MQIKSISLLVACLTSCFQNTAQNSKNPVDPKPYVVLISLDGFRHDLANDSTTPNLMHIARTGVKAQYLEPCFPTITFPNHYSIVTGLYPDHHGIINNHFYDPLTNKFFHQGKDSIFYGGEPIWITAKKNKIESQVFFWPGSETGTQGYKNFIPYDHHKPNQARVDSVMKWIAKENGPHLILLYFSDPDETEHSFGPGSKETQAKLKEIDSYIGILNTFVDDFNQSETKKINVIIVSDHGMQQCESKNTYYINDTSITNNCETIIPEYGPVITLKTKKNQLESVYKKLSTSSVEGHFKVWKNNELPKRFHYGSNPRTLDMTILADSSWTLRFNKKEINISDYIPLIDTDGVKAYSSLIKKSDSIIMVKLNYRNMDQTIAKIKSIQKGNVQVWKNADVPENYKQTNLFTPKDLGNTDLTIKVDKGWKIYWNFSFGVHGYDPANSNMRAIFYAFGPAFENETTVPPFKNIDVYSIICKILNIPEAKGIDGSSKDVEEIFKKK